MNKEYNNLNVDNLMKTKQKCLIDSTKNNKKKSD